MKDSTIYDVLIIGAGPAGCAAAQQLSGKGLKIALVEKYRFPRDKICGDALSPDVVKQLKLLDPQIADQFSQEARRSNCYGLRLFAQKGAAMDLKFPEIAESKAPCFVMRRLDFDHFLFKTVASLDDISIFQEQSIYRIDRVDAIWELHSSDSTFRAKVLLGADGAQSKLRSSLLQAKIDKKHHVAGLRQYFQNVKGMGARGQLELHFYPEIAPGYFWIFPLSEHEANVGIGMISASISKAGVNLKERLAQLIKEHPQLKARFAEAQALEDPRGFGLPLGSLKRPCSGDGFLLLGDAAGLIDPLSGEGIGNAIRSGRVAAEHLQKAFKEQRFDAEFNKAYDREIYRRMWNEFRLSVFLRRIIFYFPLYNRLVRYGGKSRFVRNLLSSIIDNSNFKKSLFSPKFYWQLFRA